MPSHRPIEDSDPRSDVMCKDSGIQIQCLREGRELFCVWVGCFSPRKIP